MNCVHYRCMQLCRNGPGKYVRTKNHKFQAHFFAGKESALRSRSDTDHLFISLPFDWTLAPQTFIWIRFMRLQAMKKALKWVKTQKNLLLSTRSSTSYYGRKSSVCKLAESYLIKPSLSIWLNQKSSLSHKERAFTLHMF